MDEKAQSPFAWLLRRRCFCVLGQTVHLAVTVVLLEPHFKQMESRINKLKGPADVLAREYFFFFFLPNINCKELEISVAIFLTQLLSP